MQASSIHPGLKPSAASRHGDGTRAGSISAEIVAVRGGYPGPRPVPGRSGDEFLRARAGSDTLRPGTDRGPYGLRLRRAGGFTLWEMLIVIGIIGALTAISMPAIQNLRKTNVMGDATRQFLDDLAYARLRAIKDRTTVHVVFVPTNILTFNLAPGPLTDRLRRISSAYSGYALFAERTAGDQPGRPFFRYLTDWKTLPKGVIFAPANYDASGFSATNYVPLEYIQLPFPTSLDPDQRLPHVAFDAQGSLVYESERTRWFRPQNIYLASGGVEGAAAGGQLAGFRPSEQPPGNGANNMVHIDGFTGRARLQRPEIQ